MSLSPKEIRAIAKAVVDEQERRAEERAAAESARVSPTPPYHKAWSDVKEENEERHARMREERSGG